MCAGLPVRAMVDQLQMTLPAWGDPFWDDCANAVLACLKSWIKGRPHLGKKHLDPRHPSTSSETKSLGSQVRLLACCTMGKNVYTEIKCHSLLPLDDIVKMVIQLSSYIISNTYQHQFALYMDILYSQLVNRSSTKTQSRKWKTLMSTFWRTVTSTQR